MRPRFSLDEMLGSLAKWLRIMGYDALYHRDLDDGEILRRAEEEGRTLLTRDKELAMRAGKDGLYIQSDDVMEQLRQLATDLGIRPDESLTRCTVCNGELETVGPSEVGEEIPEGALESNRWFFRCTRCGKVYWKGSHWKDIRARMEEIGNSDRDHSR
ncbi:MAG: Mut7-C RNAse domain-containing protein [Methanomassiliicoccales archaeon]